MRRSEAILLVLFILTGLVYVQTRQADPIADIVAAPAQAAAANVAASAAAAIATALPGPTAVPEVPYFSTAWAAAHPAAGLPPVTAEGIYVADLGTQQLIYARNPDERRPPASIMKIVTAMVALDSAVPSTLITVSKKAAEEEPNRMGLVAGEQLTVGDLLYGLLLDSGNDAAEALADALPGGRPAFMRRMNEKATSLGLRNSHFVDPSGLDDDNYSTPSDMAVLAAAALTGYPTLRTAAGTKQQQIPSTPGHKWFAPTNLNNLLWDYPGTYGVKVGYTDAADYTIILAAQRDGRHLLVVLLASKRHFGDGRALLDWAFARLPTADSAPVKRFATNQERVQVRAP